MRIITATLVILATLIPISAWAGVTLSVTNAGVPYTYTLEDLEAMNQTTVTTSNDYVEDTTEFTGPLLRDVLASHDIGPTQLIRMKALNDFSVTMPASDAFNYNVILALTQNGNRMHIRDKGPIWVIYPMDEHPELQAENYNSRLVWQLSEIIVE